MKGFCPWCEEETDLVRVQRMENVGNKGAVVSIEVDLFECIICKMEFDNPDPTYDPIETAYRKFNSLTNSDIGNLPSK